MIGMITNAGGQYQFDGNAGLLAVVHEMLLQSHIPQVLYKLQSKDTFMYMYVATLRIA